MPIPAKVKKYLDTKGIDYEELAHKTVFTAYDAAQTLKKQLKEIAKTILIEADKTHVLVVLPADKKIDMAKLKKVLGAKSVRIPDEKVMIKVLKIKPGTLSSFGRLHDMEVVVDKAMIGVKKAVVSTGSFTDSVLMKVKDFVQSEEARLVDIAMKGGYKVPKATKKKMIKVKKQVQARKGKKTKIKVPKTLKKLVKPAKKALKAAIKRPIKKSTGKSVSKKTTVSKKISKRR
ncbi:MAG: YbaK/EbsC family protein [Patescibacteria group bacterium]|jgi:prolyl-tRNA editing enzyme YbaK/EbsC (Cys-tRNA(Pro) deacylase)